MARTMTCDCGEVLTGQDDADLVRVWRVHANLVHPDREVTNTEIRARIAAEAMDAPESMPSIPLPESTRSGDRTLPA